MEVERERLLELLESEGPRLFSLLTKLTLREGVAEDLMQELFLRLSRSASWAKAKDPVAYMRQAAVHLAFDWRRKARRHPSPTDLAMEPADDGPSPHERMSRMEEYDRVLRAASQLSASRHEVFVMRYIEELSPEEIGRRVGRSPHQVRSMCHKALMHVRKLIGREDRRG